MEKGIERLKFKIKEKKLENKVELTGSLYGDDLRLRYSSCDIYTSASKNEAFNLPILEAMAWASPYYYQIFQDSKN